MSVLSEDFSPLSTPRTEQQKGDWSVTHLLAFSESRYSPGLTYSFHVRKVGGLTMTFPDNQGPYGLQYKSVTVLLWLEPYSASYSEVFLKLWFNNLLGFALILISSFIETYWQPFLYESKKRLPWHSWQKKQAESLHSVILNLYFNQAWPLTSHKKKGLNFTVSFIQTLGRKTGIISSFLFSILLTTFVSGRGKEMMLSPT